MARSEQLTRKSHSIHCPSYRSPAMEDQCCTCGPTVEELAETRMRQRAELTEPDAVEHPPHYTMGRIEVLDAIEDWQLGYHEGNVVKYVARAKHKGAELQDLKKAATYLRRRIALLEGAGCQPTKGE